LFAIRIVKLYSFLCDEKKEFVLSKQLLRSGTVIGALIKEAEFGQSKADFINKMSIALKEANETDYWLHLLKDTDFLNEKMFESISADCVELIKMLVATVKTSKQ
jgi:four helix bundle protein